MKYAGIWLPAWLLSLAVFDWRERRVPNTLLLLGLVFSCFQHWVYRQQELLDWRNYYLIAVVWIGAAVLWGSTLWGGGDAKFSMVLVLALPFFSLVFLQILALLGISLWQLFIGKTPGKGVPAVSVFAVIALAWYSARFAVSGVL